MRFYRILGPLVLICVTASVLHAADISGKWTSESGQGPQWVFNFKTAGDTLSGTMQGTDGKARAINDGKLAGDTLSFSVDSEWQGQPVKLLMKGKISENKIDLRVDTDDGAWGTDVVLTRSPN